MQWIIHTFCLQWSNSMICFAHGRLANLSCLLYFTDLANFKQRSRKHLPGLLRISIIASNRCHRSRDQLSQIKIRQTVIIHLCFYFMIYRIRSWHLYSRLVRLLTKAFTIQTKEDPHCGYNFIIARGENCDRWFL